MKGKAPLAPLAGVLVAVCLAWPAAGATRPSIAHANSAGFSDPAGDSGAAPDINGVSVSNDDAGTITFAATVGNRTVFGPQDVLLLAMDTDGNASPRES